MLILARQVLRHHQAGELYRWVSTLERNIEKMKPREKRSYDEECPWCGEFIDDIWDYDWGSKSEIEVECPHCEQLICIGSRISYVIVAIEDEADKPCTRLTPAAPDPADLAALERDFAERQYRLADEEDANPQGG